MIASACLLCRTQQVEQLLDFGPQPICNRFLAAPDSEEAAFPMRLGQCGACGLVQMIAPVPAAELKPRCDWITYNEPEEHLDRLADVLAALPGLTKQSAVCGISFKDDSLLRRLRERGYLRTRRIDPCEDLGIPEAGVGVETIQHRLDSQTTAQIAAARGRSDLVIARHIWEHVSDPAGFVHALKGLMTPNGYLLFEIPDCERALDACDYSTVWEEHTLYFTPATFRRGVSVSGLALSYYECFPQALENSLVAVGRLGEDGGCEPLSTVTLEQEKSRGKAFADGLAVHRKRIGSYFARYRREHGKIAILGAGHLACTYINLLELREHIDCLVDDNPHKRGTFMPGSRLPIYDSSALIGRGIKLCLLSVNGEIEARVIQKNAAFTQAGGVFHSIFPTSRHTLRF